MMCDECGSEIWQDPTTKQFMKCLHKKGVRNDLKKILENKK
jgi:hypothetical protein